MEKITKINCQKIANKEEIFGDVNGQAKCWKTVWNFCSQNEMECKGMTGIESVINFIENLCP